MKAVVVLNGAPPQPNRLRALAAHHPVYVADGGAKVCLDAGVRPEWVAGDLDSAALDQLPDDWEVRSHPEQTRTDFQKVIADIPEEVTEIVILGGLGNRTDHTLTNLMIAAEFSAQWKVTFEGQEETLIRITPATSLEIKPPVGSTVSLIPLPEAQGVSTQGLRWNLMDATMKVGGQLGQSNEVTGSVMISVASGCLYLWQGLEKNPDG